MDKNTKIVKTFLNSFAVIALFCAALFFAVEACVYFDPFGIVR